MSKPKHRPAPAAAAAPPAISGRWLLGAIGATLAAAAVCAWCALCLLFWQGSWQLLYHPSPAVTRTPASAGLLYDSIGFAAAETGEPRLRGWWIPATPGARLTVLYLHGQNGNLSDAVDALAQLHAAGVNLLAFDYRGYGQSRFAHPGEASWRQDAEWALQYLTATRHMDPRTIVLDGKELGANLALEVAAAHPELGGVIVDSPLERPVEIIFSDPRARLAPAHWLVADRYDLDAAAIALRVPSLWIVPDSPPAAYEKVPAPRQLVVLSSTAHAASADAAGHWLAQLSGAGTNR